MDEESGNTPRHNCRDKDVLGIHSPSAEMHAIGANLGMGLMAGLMSLDVPGQVARHLARSGGAASGGLTVGVSGGSIAGGMFPSSGRPSCQAPAWAQDRARTPGPRNRSSFTTTTTTTTSTLTAAR